ncbi:MAG: HD domain-containing protein [Bacteroidetes bacterium]|nr:HD domain-containing protein [Bacteroidota bacterium]MBU1579692.1 HD domain-containing protein [Bacteroidota bacterium]MBU2465316.1 HD domain-containing protein [Bacteroidota bacterium]MBU2558953.1 HD domain-containing protein [Bacteroidota bacterium]
MEETLIDKTREFVIERLKNSESGHDWLHIERVFQNALQLCQNIACDRTLVLITVLLHDLNDSKFNAGREDEILVEIKAFLQKNGLSKTRIEAVETIIQTMSFRHSFEAQTEKSIEFQIVQDADRLDAIGAVGIARAFSYGGYKGRLFYADDQASTQHQSSASYQNSKAATINHFYEKLLLLKDQMNTAQAKKLAENRHQFMLQFLAQFEAEKTGKA